MNAAADGRGKQRIGDRRPGNPSPAFRAIVGGRPDLRRRQIGSGFTRIFVALAGFRVGLGASGAALRRREYKLPERERELKLMLHVARTSGSHLQVV